MALSSSSVLSHHPDKVNPRYTERPQERRVSGRCSLAVLQGRSVGTRHPSSRTTKRTTFHVEQRWIEAIRRQADLHGFTYTQIVNKAFHQYFQGL
jgi:predicted DNA binding CopG/RHH family protein